METTTDVPQDTKSRTNTQNNCSTIEYIFQRNNFSVTNRNLHLHVYYRSTHNSQHKESTEIAICE